MNLRFLLVLCMGIPCALFGGWSANHSNRAENNAEQLIKTAIQNYQDGFNQRDAELLRQAFHEGTGHVKSISKNDDGTDKVRVTAVSDWIKKVTPEGENRDIKIRILSINMVNDQIANVFIDFDGVLFDMLLVAKVDGNWRILNKVSIYQDQAE